MSKKILVILAGGFEEIETVTPIDVLRRAGLNVVIAGLGEKIVRGAHNISIETDVLLKDYHDTPDAVILPGGIPGAKYLGESDLVKAIVEKTLNAHRLVGAICAAPALVLAPAGHLENKKATCYPGFEKNFGGSTQFVTDRVVTDGNIITSRGPGTAIEFAIELVRILVGDAKSQELREGMIAR